MKKSTLFLCVLLLSSTLFAQELRIGILNGSSCVPVAYLMENKKEIAQTTLSYDKFADPQALLPKMLKNEIDIGFMPVNVACKVYNASNKAIVCAAVCGNGNLSIITKDKTVKRITDLEGKTVYVAGQGATPEYIFNYILNQQDMADKVTCDFSISPQNLPAALISGKIDYALVPEPFATLAVTKDKSIVYAIDIQKEFKNLSSIKSYPLTCIVVRSKYAQENKEVVQEFLNEFSNAVNWTNENAKLSGEYCEKFQLGLAKAVVSKSIPKANYVFIPAVEARNEIEAMLKIFVEENKASIGENLPDEGFYLK